MKKKIFIVVVLCICIILSRCNQKKNNEEDTVKKIDINVIEPILLTKKIVIEDSRNATKIKEITDAKDIDRILNILSSSYLTDEIVTTESSNWYFLLYDSDNKIISKLWVWKSGHFGFSNDKEYTFSKKSQDLQNIIND